MKERVPLALLVVMMSQFLSLALNAEDLAAPRGEQPLRPIPVRPGIITPKERLGRSLFADNRLSGSGSVSCLSCHDVTGSGASKRQRDIGDSGRLHRYNTPTIFNVAHSYQLNWEGRRRSLRQLVESSLSAPDLMGDAGSKAHRRMAADKTMRFRFAAIYGRPPDRAAIVDALTHYVASLTTPNAPFDRWLRGEGAAIDPVALRGYRLFREIGCAACHQGVNAGGNLRQQSGIFHPLGTNARRTLRVPPLRNVALTAPYFHDGSSPTLAQAIRRMARSQLDRSLADADVIAIEAFLRALTAPNGQSATPAAPARDPRSAR